MRDLYLDNNFREENSELGYWSRSAEKLSELESELNELGDYGLAVDLNAFWDSWEALSDNLDGQHLPAYAARIGAKPVRLLFTRYTRPFPTNTPKSDKEIRDIASTVNGIGDQLATLNMQIQQAEQTGTIPNDLLDKWDKLLDDLSEYGDISVQTHNDGSRVVYFGSDQLVLARFLAPSAGLHEQHRWPRDQQARMERPPIRASTGLQNGQLAGLMNLRDNQLTSYMEKLDNLAVNLAQQLNAIHRQGTGLGDPPSTNLDFFASDITGAADFRLSDEIAASPDKIAASLGGRRGRQPCRIDDYRASVRGNDGQSVVRRVLWIHAFLDRQRTRPTPATQSDMLELTATQVDNYRESVKGVSIDEESVNLLSYQRSYQAAAKVVEMADELMGTIMGLVR